MSQSVPLPPELQDGASQNVYIGINQLVFHDGSTISLSPTGVTVIVGSNNVGKSTLLSEISAVLRHGIQSPHLRNKVLSRLELECKGSRNDLLDWFVTRVPYRSSYGGEGGFAGWNHRQVVDPRNIAGHWDAAVANGALGGLEPYFVKYLGGQERLGGVNHTARRENISEPPSHPFHYLEDNRAMMDQLNDLSVRIFRQELTLDTLGTNARLLLGKPGVPTPRIDDITAEYRDALLSLPDLAIQGDGMRSLIGLCLPIIAGTHRIVLIDEPEAFLHPPQAAALGYELGELAKARGLQIVLATHDRNIVTGLLRSTVDVSVVRLNRRSQGETAAYQLDPAKLRSVWDDPVLRYSNILDGLFHRLVILAEADGDCRFYSAALDKLCSVEDFPFAPTDVLFVPSGGKAGLSKLASALHEVRVPVVASPDLDVLDQSSILKGLVEAFHGEWDKFREDYREALRPLRESQSVALLKSAGIQAFPNGESYSAATRLLDGLGVIGIVPVRVGELERYAPSLAGKGLGWLLAALGQLAHESEPAQEHVRRIISAKAQVL